jgi:amino acid permease
MTEGQIVWLVVGVIVVAIAFPVVRERYENWLYTNRRHPVARTYESIANAIGAFLGVIFAGLALFVILAIASVYLRGLAGLIGAILANPGEYGGGLLVIGMVTALIWVGTKFGGGRPGPPHEPPL